jgi:predicted negative regulator of RcsB-dependent stress response
MEAGTPRSAGIYDLLGWFETNKKRVGIAVGALAVAALVAGLFVWQRGQQETDAEQALSSVHIPFSPSEPIAAGTGDALAKVAEEYPGTAAAPKALLRAGAAYFAENNFPKAQETFEKLLSKYGDTVWVPQAVYGLAAVFEAQGKTTEAVSRYKDFSEKYAADPAAEQAKLNLARLYEQTQQPALALDVYKKMTENVQVVGYSPGAAEANERMSELLKKHPALRPPQPIDPSMLTFSNLPPVPQTPQAPGPGPAPNILTPQTPPGPTPTPNPNTPPPAATPAPGPAAPAAPGEAPKIILPQGNNKP